ncbi:MAG: GTPase, partial [Phycisphaerae bacterium]
MSDAAPSVFAPLTAPGRGGIAVIRATGPRVAEALAACFRPVGGAPFEPAAEAAGRLHRPRPTTKAGEDDPLLPQRARPAPRGSMSVGRLAYGHILDAEGQVLDEIILHRAGPETWEVNCHGGPAAVEGVCERLAALGLTQVDADALRAAEGMGPVERTARRLLRTAATPLAARILLDQFMLVVRGAQENRKRGAQSWAPRDGETPREGRGGQDGPPRNRDQLGGALEQAVADAAAGRTDEAAAAIDALLDRWKSCGRYLAAPPRVVIAGRPNVGKSTLLNRLAGRERAIAHPEPGTTRDYVETVTAFDGLPVVLVDTAGLRETLERIEREGVARARRQAAGADLVVYLLDAGVGTTEEDDTALAHLGDRALAVWNKADLPAGPLGAPPALAVSTQTGAGLHELRQEV